MEGGMGPKMSLTEQAMYDKFVEKNPGMTESDFLELRAGALSAHSMGAKKFYQAGGILMEEVPQGDAMKELTEDNKAGE